MIDIATQIGAIDRTVRLEKDDNGVDTVVVVARRTYDAEVSDVWDALTDPDRMVRWFLPVSGDLREGGSFQLEGNAGGDILECTRPSLLRVTFGSEVSIVALSLIPVGAEETLLELMHSDPLELAQSGAGAMWAGPGWDGALMGLGFFLAGETVDDPVAAANSPEAVAFNERSVHEWASVVEASGTATPEQLAEAVQISLAQFAPGSDDQQAAG
jgi:uncharacterized protein YndB with AHSA1/START domain